MTSSMKYAYTILQYLNMVTFAQTTFAHKDICPDGHLPRRHLPRRTSAQKNICPERHLPLSETSLFMVSAGYSVGL
jgi:hypothetical protein